MFLHDLKILKLKIVKNTVKIQLMLESSMEAQSADPSYIIKA